LRSSGYNLVVSKYYNPKRTRNIFDPNSKTNFKLSRSKLELFSECPKCFYIDRRLGVGRPPGFPFSLNSAVDTLLKKEFDHFRNLKQPHPLMIKNKIDAIPFAHESLDNWRDSLRKGIEYNAPGINLTISGGVDDIWVNPKGELIIVDYKATSKTEEVTLDAEWQNGYKRQMEIYQWLFQKNGFQVHEEGIFVYCNGKTDIDEFDAKLCFDIKLIPYKGSTEWIDDFVQKAHQCLNSDQIPEPSENCDYCAYQNAVASVLSEVEAD